VTDQASALQTLMIPWYTFLYPTINETIILTVH